MTSLDISTSPLQPDDGSRHDGQEADHELLAEWMLVSQAVRTTHESLLRELAERFDLAEGFVEVLVHLGGDPLRRLPMTQVARTTGMSSGGFTKLADRLCKAGFAKRVACEADRRVTYLELTEKGELTVQGINKAAAEILDLLVIGPLGQRDFRTLTRVMAALRGASVGLRA